MLYKNPLLFLSLIPIFIGILGLVINYSDKVEYDNGTNIYALIIEEPIDCDEINYKTSFIKLEYNNRTFIKNIGLEYCENIGKAELLVRVNKSRDELFFIGEDFDGNIGASLLILLIGIIIAIKGIKK
jgi:hypothetical protein